MDSFIKTFFGNDETVSVNDYEVLMTSGFPLWALLVCAVGLAVYSWYLYKKETPSTSNKRRVILSALRWATCFLLFLLILQPTDPAINYAA